MIALEEISKSYGQDRLLEDVSWQLPVGEVVGLVGPNGVGKTTLLRILVDQESPDTGQVIRPRGVQVGYLPQEITEADDGTVLDAILQGRADLLALEAELKELERRLQNDQSEEVTRAYDLAQDRFRREGGYELRSRAFEIGAGMGFSDEEFHRPLAEFSGGWKMRAFLARLLLRSPDLLLLDEPTNHLDLESIEWLEGFLKNYPGTIILISHDREFMNRLVDQITEIHARDLAHYRGNYDKYLVEREERRQRLLDAAARQAREIERIQTFIDRFRYKASKASQVQSRVKQLEKIEPIEVPPAYDSQISFEFPQPPRVGKTVLEARGLTKSFGDNHLYQGAGFTLHRGERVAFVGPNGAGKSTLLKMLAGRLPPDSGEVHRGHQVEVAYFAQHSVDQLDLQNTILDELEGAASFEATPRVRSILGAFQFSGDDVHKRISVLSGGEKSRVALAKLLLEPAGCLLLDEPTNHLDIPSRRVLEQGLRDFGGALCVISHDRAFLSQVVNRVVRIDEGRLKDYPGTFEEYRWRRAREGGEVEEGDDSGASEVLSRKDLRRLRAELRQERDAEVGTLRQELNALETRIEELEREVAGLEEKLADPQTYEGGGESVAGLQKSHGELSSELAAVLESWEEKGGLLEEIEQRYASREEALESP